MARKISNQQAPFRHTMTSLLLTVGVVGSLATFAFPTLCGNAGHGDGPVMTDLDDSNTTTQSAHPSAAPASHPAHKDHQIAFLSSGVRMKVAA